MDDGVGYGAAADGDGFVLADHRARGGVLVADDGASAPHGGQELGGFGGLDVRASQSGAEEGHEKVFGVVEASTEALAGGVTHLREAAGEAPSAIDELAVRPANVRLGNHQGEIVGALDGAKGDKVGDARGSGGARRQMTPRQGEGGGAKHGDATMGSGGWGAAARVF